jgi:UDP-N-acetylmuramoylalanine--D-glutamate ligase
MENKLSDFKEYIKGKKTAIIGLGISNTPLAGYLARLGTDITVFDRSYKENLESYTKKLKGLNIKYRLGEKYLEYLQGFDIIFKTPSIRPDIPELINEKKRGAYITSEMEMFLKLCPAKVFAVTGSDGKTTTTTIIYRILKNNGYKCWLGGNIGKPLFDKLDSIGKDDMVVVELSSFQLFTMKVSPNIAIITNLSPNHLDIHKSMDEYINAKTNIFKFQNKNDILILNNDNGITKNMARNVQSKVLYFSRKTSVLRGVFLKSGTIFYRDGQIEEPVINITDIAIPGVHNVENYMASIAAVKRYVNNKSILNTAISFKGVEHRIEFIKEVKGIRFYDDSIGTSPARTSVSIKVFNEKVILIAGGYDKKIPYDNMGNVLLDRVKCLVLIGQTAKHIEKSMIDAAKNRKTTEIPPVLKCETLEDAVAKAFLNASRGDVILLSPASASFDMFKNFEERGDRFKKIVEMMVQ